MQRSADQLLHHFSQRPRRGATVRAIRALGLKVGGASSIGFLSKLYALTVKNVNNIVNVYLISSELRTECKLEQYL